MTATRRFRLIEHTADMGIEAWGDSLPDVFAAMALGLKDLMLGDSPTSRSLQIDISLQAENDAELLVVWLNEIIYRFETMDLVPDTLHIERVENGRLQATIHGERFDPGRHLIERQAKAATYHQLLLEESTAGWHARIYIDL